MSDGVPPVALIAVGASAGGLAALRALLGGFATGLEASLIIVQHLDPDRDSMLVPLLEKVSALPVVEIRDRIAVETGTVYVGPPGKYLDLEGGTIRLTDPPGHRFGRTPIDHLFKQLADLHGPAAIGVVLSGTGSDGAQGLCEIKSAGGLCLVQSPEEAEFDGMPQAAIKTRCVDIVDTVGALAQRLAIVIEGERRAAADDGGTMSDPADSPQFAEVLELLNGHQGADFRNYKTGTLNRRIRRRMGIRGKQTLRGYADLLRADAAERDLLVKDLLIGVTRFFRDPEVWQEIATGPAERLVQTLTGGEAIRAWCAGCATGEEAYTLAMVLRDAVARSGKDIEVLIFATDVNEDAIEWARAGRYPAASIADLDPELARRWFTENGAEVRVRAELRECVVFAAQNAIFDPPFSSLDLISCRNLMIYLDREAQKRLFETFHFSLRPAGTLVLGMSETAESRRDLFEPTDKKNRIYSRIGTVQTAPPAGSRSRRDGPAPAKEPADPPLSPPTSDAVVRAMLSRFAPPAVLVDRSFDVQRFHGELQPYLSFSRGSMSGNLISMLTEGYQGRVWSALKEARSADRVAERRISAADGSTRQTRVIVEPIQISRANSGFLVYFQELPAEAGSAQSARPGPGIDGATGGATGESRGAAAPHDAGLLDEYQAEIEMLRQELQSVIETQDASTEELQAANEEVMSTNEELQSSNEELETSREELQSLNEELSTINSELEDKVQELEATNDDLANLISSTDIATLFLDTALAIRRFSHKTRELFALRDTDVGRPLGDLNMKIADPTLLEDARRVLDRLVRSECEVSGDGYAYLRRIVPYRTHADRIDGVIVTYSDIQRLREAAEKLSEQARRQTAIAILGEMALTSETPEALFARAAEDIAAHTGSKFVEIQRLDPSASQFQLVAGSGWARGMAGHALTPNDPANHLGMALRRLGTTEVADFDSDPRLAPSQLLADHGVRGGACIVIGPPQSPWGLLGCWRGDPGPLDEAERNFLTQVANILWLSISQIAARQLRENERAMLQNLMDGLPTMIAVVDASLRFEMANRAFDRLGLIGDEVHGSDIEGVLGPEASRAIKEAIRPGDETEETAVEAVIPIPGEGLRTFLIHCAPRLIDGQFAGYYIAAMDIEERKQSEERNRTISAELDHRVKNILALVRTIARMTGRNTRSIAEFQKVFSDRIQSLSRTHAALALSKWSGLHLEQLLRAELEAYGDPSVAQRVEIAGPPVRLNARATQSLSLVFHELTTNAVKYGALSRHSGRLDVRWTFDGHTLSLKWDEQGVTGLTQPEARGFGSTVIESAVEQQLGGDLVLQYRSDGLLCEMNIPAPKLNGALDDH